MSELLSLPGLIGALVLAAWYLMKRYKAGLVEQAKLEAESTVRKERLQVLKTDAEREGKQKDELVKSITEFLGSDTNGKPGGGSDGGNDAS